MALFDRYRAKTLGTAIPLQVTVRRANAAATDPFSPDFAPRCGDNSQSLVNYLIACQVQRQGSSVSKELLERYGMLPLQRSVKILMRKRKCSPRTIKRAILLASYRSNYPFTFKYVEKLLDEVLEQCPE